MPKSVLSLLSALFLLQLVTGCAFFKPKIIADLTKNEPGEILARVSQNHDRIHALSGKGLIVVEMPGNAFQGNATIEVLRRDSLFIKAEAAFGIDVGYFFANRKMFAHYSPFENALYRGPIEKVNKLILFQMKITYDELLSAVLGTLDFKFTQETSVSIENNHYIFRQKRDSHWLSVAVDPAKYVITKAELATDAGKIIARQEFKFFHKINGIWFPKSVQLRKLDSRERLTIKYSKVELNKAIPPNKFDFKVPGDARRYRLK
ncbi:MAG: DUF4292 domain-containing protein [Calditrichaeota bacterium]|nr:MAG: DUF4292 domain-containing protein [Calditrichota bacterium]